VLPVIDPTRFAVYRIDCTRCRNDCEATGGVWAVDFRVLLVTE
jgi:hypothetical protein